MADTKAATTRAVIKDFAHPVDKLDLMGIDADTTVAGRAWAAPAVNGRAAPCDHVGGRSAPVTRA